MHRLSQSTQPTALVHQSCAEDTFWLPKMTPGSARKQPESPCLKNFRRPVMADRTTTVSRLSLSACKVPEGDVSCRSGPQLPVASLIQQFEGRKPPQIPHLTLQLEQEDQQSDLEKPRTPPKLESPLPALHRWVAMLIISKGRPVLLLSSSTHIPCLHHCTGADGLLEGIFDSVWQMCGVDLDDQRSA